MTKTFLFGVGLAVLVGCSASAAEPPANGCIDLTGSQATAALSGVLTIQLFAGAPNYESIAQGDAEERVFILELPKRTCANDGDFISPVTPFDRVQVSAEDERLSHVLRASVGRDITVRGKAFGAHTGHHHAPLILLAKEVSVR